MTNRTTSRKPDGARRCDAYRECAYWAFTVYESPDGKKRKALCSLCSKLYKLDGWIPVTGSE